MSWTVTAGQPVPVDLKRSDVSLLLHGDGSNGSTTITDTSPTPKTVTAVGDAKISTAQSKFGGSSIAFDGNGDYITIPYSSAFDYGFGDFTIEGWIYPQSFTDNPSIYSQRYASGNPITIRLTTAGVLTFFYGSSSGTISGASTTLNTWQHFAVTRNNTVVYLWLNGQNTGSGTTNINLTDNSSVNIGRTPQFNSEFFKGYIDELRITKGVARYTSNFTPPTAPFPDL